jgi:penicillin-binding protein 2
MDSSSSFTSANRDTGTTLLLGFQVGVALVFGALVVTFWNFQVGQYARFSEMAENNHQRTLNLRAPRGVVFDRNGRVLVENRYSLNLSLVREQVSDLEQALVLLADVTGTDVDRLREAIEENRSVPVYRPIVLIRDASLDQIASVAAHALELPGVVVEQIPTRHYPSETLASHLFGYVGEVTDSQLRSDHDPRVIAGSVIGQSGVERAYNTFLMGEDGTRHVVVNSVGREIETIDEVPPAEGQQIQLTIDYDLQTAAENAFALEGFSGAAVALDPQTGEVLALASLPAYNPNDFALGIDGQTWSTLNTDRLRPLENRALRGRYSPGSTFKLVMAVAALQEGIVQPNFKVNCRGGGTFYGRFFRCHSRHGTVAMVEALEKSCNTYFYTLGSMIDVDAINRWAVDLGLGALSGIDLPFEVRGLVPSRAWKRERFGEPWYPGETISVSIGQGAVSVTPISMAVMMATVANGGRRVVPHLLRATRSEGAWTPVQTPAPTTVDLAPQTVETLRRGLWMVVNRRGTGGRSRIADHDVIGKTGTAQVISLQGRAAAVGTDLDLRDHGWFVFAAPRDNPEIAGVVFAEHSEHGYLAAPIAKHIMETFFAKKEGRPLPTLPLPAQPIAVPVVTAEGQ